MVATVMYWSCAATLMPSFSIRYDPTTLQLCNYSSPIVATTKKMNSITPPIIFYCSLSNTSTILSSPSEVDEEEEEEETAAALSRSPSTITNNVPMKKRRRRRYRKQYPGEKIGITEEMRFVAMKLRNTKPKASNNNTESETDNGDTENDDVEINAVGESISSSLDENNDKNGETWQPSMEGFLKFLVDSKLVFNTIERIVEESSDVSYAYFRKTGLERSHGLSKDLEWFSQQDHVIPKPSNPGVNYAKYLEELGEKNPPLFLCHFYNIYFSHIAGGQVIAKQVSDKLLEGREMEFYRWDANTEELMRGVREKLNQLGEHWSRDEKNKGLREATKAFRFLGQIVRLIIL